jgi:enamine deaminase RidA (YjgF/YER057c/UK114 family)
MGKLAGYRRARDRFFSTVSPPAAPAITLLEVSRLYLDSLLIEVEAVAAL